MPQRFPSTPLHLLGQVLGCLLFAALPLIGCVDTAWADPRIRLVELQISSNDQEALQVLEQVLAEDPDLAHRLGLDYLRGHLLLEMDHRREAHEAFATTMNTTPLLKAFSRYRLALEQENQGYPKVAAGLVATLLRSSPPKSLVSPAVHLLRRTVRDGGDCRVLRGLEPSRFRKSDRRELTLARAECHVREDQTSDARQLWFSLLEENRKDPVARVAAERLTADGPEKESARAYMLIGLAFHHHREFETSIVHLARALERKTSAPKTVPKAVSKTSSVISRGEIYELRYALARSHFWQERYAEAAVAFAALARETTSPRQKAQALYQQARCHELSGKWDLAIPSFEQAFKTDPAGGWADSALIAGMRLKWRGNQEESALSSLNQLLVKRHFGTASRALLFLASSDLVSGRADRAGAWLEKARELRRVAPRETAYWQARLAEFEQKPAQAVEQYLLTIQQDPYHPLARSAQRRLASMPLAAVARAKAATLAASSSPADLYAAWLLLPPADPMRLRVRGNLEQQLRGDPSVTTFLRLETQPTADWPLWSVNLERPEEMLLALGLFHEVSSKVLRHFPVARPNLAFTGSLVLARTGDTHRSVYIAEILSKRVPQALPTPFLPSAFRQLLYPSAYQPVIRREAERRQIDPHLLAGLIREESRFDPRAFSAASARGLTQFVFPTARDVAARHELGAIEPQDLERPEIAIALGAAYLRQLHDELGSLPEVVAAYNAGEPQSALWRRYCLSEDIDEYLTKVAFRETRNYLARVLTSRAQYAELYPMPSVRVGEPE